jgi:hypothetical protein
MRSRRHLCERRLFERGRPLLESRSPSLSRWLVVGGGLVLAAGTIGIDAPSAEAQVPSDVGGRAAVVVAAARAIDIDSGSREGPAAAISALPGVEARRDEVRSEPAAGMSGRDVAIAGAIGVAEVAVVAPAPALVVSPPRVTANSRESVESAVPEAREVPRTPGGSRQKRRSSRSAPEWVGIHSLTPPSEEFERVFREAHKQDEPLPWYVAERRGVEFEEPPPYVSYSPPPLFHIEPPPDTRYARAVKRIVRKKLYSELRSEAKQTWREAYAETPRMDYAFFENRLLQINRLGREPDEYDLFHDDYYTRELKEDVFRGSYRGGESDIPLLAWGPFVVTDGGSMRVDLARVIDFEEPEKVEIEGGEVPKKPFLASETYRIDTNVRIHFDPVQAVEEQDATWVIKRYGVAVTIDWLSDVLGAEMMSTEIEAEIERDGDFAVALNFVIRSRD